MSPYWVHWCFFPCFSVLPCSKTTPRFTQASVSFLLHHGKSFLQSHCGPEQQRTLCVHWGLDTESSHSSRPSARPKSNVSGESIRRASSPPRTIKRMDCFQDERRSRASQYGHPRRDAGNKRRYEPCEPRRECNERQSVRNRSRGHCRRIDGGRIGVAHCFLRDTLPFE